MIQFFTTRRFRPEVKQLKGFQAAMTSIRAPKLCRRQTLKTSRKLFWPEREQAYISKRHCRSRLAWTLYLSLMVLRKYTEMFFAISDALLREAYPILQEAMYPKYGDRGWTQMQVYSMAYPEYNHWSFCRWTSLFYCGFVHCLLALCCVSLSQINPWLESCRNQECAFTNQA